MDRTIMSAQLQILVRLRKYELDREQVQLSRALQDERELARRLAEVDQQVESQRTQLATLMHNGQLNIEAVRLRQQYLQVLGEQLRDLQSQMAVAQGVTQDSRARVLSADQRHQVARELRERVIAEAAAQRVRLESREIEEAWQNSHR